MPRLQAEVPGGGRHPGDAHRRGGKILDFGSRRIEKVLTDPPVLLSPLLRLFSLVFRMLSASRRVLYRAGLLKRKVLPRPVISVGNLSLGGGGKTPLVIWLAQLALEEGMRPAVLTRGYGRKDGRTRIAEPSGDWREVGDEPFLISDALKGVPVAVSGDRHQGGLEVLRRGEADFFILDDGFSHLALKKDLEIVVVDDRRRFGNGRVFPGGILREPVKRLRDAGMVIVTKASAPDERFREEIRRLSNAPVYWADFRPAGLVPVGPGRKDGPAAGEGPFLGFCGIADPESFRRSLEGSGFRILELLAFPDHHSYTSSDAAAIAQAASRLGATALVTTRKDAVRWPLQEGGLPCFALAMEVVFLEGEREVKDAVRNLVLKAGETAP